METVGVSVRARRALRAGTNLSALWRHGAVATDEVRLDRYGRGGRHSGRWDLFSTVGLATIDAICNAQSAICNWFSMLFHTSSITFWAAPRISPVGAIFNKPPSCLTSA